MNDWLSVPRDWSASLGDIVRFVGAVFGDILNGRVFHFFGEALRQAGILILGSALVISLLASLLLIGVPAAWIHATSAPGARPVPAFLVLSATTICLGWALLRLIDPGRRRSERGDSGGG